MVGLWPVHQYAFPWRTSCLARNAVHAGGQSTIPELQAVLGGVEALDRTTNNAWKTEQGGSWPRSPSRRARLS